MPRVSLLTLMVSLARGSLPQWLQSVSAKTETINSLLLNYGDRSIRPGQSWAGNGSVDDVYTQFYVDRFVSLNQLRQEWGVSGYLRVWFHDPRLRYNESRGGRYLNLMPTQVEQLWRPLVYWDKLVRATGDHDKRDGFGESFIVYPDGSVSVSQQREVRLKCPMALSHLPFDVVTCTYAVSIYQFDATEVRLSWIDPHETLRNSDLAWI